MAERVHPSSNSTSPMSSTEHPLKPNPPSPEKPVPPPGTYVIQIPKDQVYRVPPPENAYRFQRYSHQKPRRSSLRLCVCSFLAFLAVLSVLAAVSGAALYLVYRPESPNFSVEAISIRGINASSQSPKISPAINLSLRAQNPNDKLGIRYQTGSSVEAFYSDLELSSGVMTAFRQPTNNVTVLKTALKGPGIELTASLKKSLRDGEKRGKVPLRLRIDFPVKVKVGSIYTWTLEIRVRCDLTVDKLTADSKLVDQKCNRSWKLWR